MNILLPPGSFATVFVADDQTRIPVAGFILRWQWIADGGLDPRLSPHLSDFEIQEAFELSLEIAAAHRNPDLLPRGLLLTDESHALIRDAGFRLGGGSLGLGFLLGLVGYSRRRSLSCQTAAWGALAPVWGNDYTLLPVEQSAAKLEIAKGCGIATILHPAEQPLVAPYGIRSCGVPRSMASAIAAIEAFVEGEGDLVH